MMAKKLKVVLESSHCNKNRPKILEFICDVSGDYIWCYAHPKTVLSMLDKKARASFKNKGYVKAADIPLILTMSNDPQHTWGHYYTMIRMSNVGDLYLFFTKENADYLVDRLETLQLEHQMAKV